METILLTRSSVMWHTHSITAHGENILVWDDVLYGFLLGVESSYSLVIAKHCYIHTYTYTLHTYPMPLCTSSATYVKILDILPLQIRKDVKKFFASILFNKSNCKIAKKSPKIINVTKNGLGQHRLG